MKKNLQVQMQKSFSLNNFDVSPSAFNPGDDVSEVVLSLSHQKQKKLKKQKNPKQHKTKKYHKVSQIQMQYSFSKFFSMQM
jgi:hypothetical protein